jgi:hypothetical protein
LGKVQAKQKPQLRNLRKELTHEKSYDIAKRFALGTLGNGCKLCRSGGIQWTKYKDIDERKDERKDEQDVENVQNSGRCTHANVRQLCKQGVRNQKRVPYEKSDVWKVALHSRDATACGMRRVSLHDPS